MTLTIFIRKLYNLQDYITIPHLESIARVLIFGSLVIGLAYLTEMFVAWYSGWEFEMFTFLKNRATGEYSTASGLWCLQRTRTTAVLVQENTHKHYLDVDYLHHHQYRHVV